MRVLTFISHQPYLYLLASALPWSIGAVTPTLPSGRIKCWDRRIRPIPPNVQVFDSLKDASNSGSWDWVLTHNVQDLLDALPINLPKVFLVHGTLSGRMLQDRARIERREYLRGLEKLLKKADCRIVYISDLKRNDWGFPGGVILPGADLEQYHGYNGKTPAVLQVCNNLPARGEMLGWRSHAEVCNGLPSLLLGENRGIAHSRHSRGWDDLKSQYRDLRVYLHTSVYPFEDGYNLAMLEAMATGMPVATLIHPTSPIRDGINGVVADNAAELRGKVVYLLDHLDQAIVMGRHARRTAEECFPIRRFANAWEELGRSILADR